MSADYSIRNLRDVEDVAPKFGYGDVHEARFPARALEAQATGLALQRVKPGCRHGLAHRHDEAEEIVVVLAGSGRVKLDDDVHAIGPLDAIRIAPHVARGFEAGDEGLEYLVFGPHHERDGELLSSEEFWGDVDAPGG